MDALITKMLEGFTVGQVVSLILLGVIAKYVSDIKDHMATFKEWRDGHEKLDHERHESLKSMIEATLGGRNG